MPPKAREEKETSMEQILQTIRGVIAGEIDKLENADEVLELTEMVAEDGSVTTIKPVANGHAKKTESNDVLSEIDSVLSDKPTEKTKAAKAAPAEKAPEQESPSEEPEPILEADPVIAEAEEADASEQIVDEVKEAVIGLADSVAGPKAKEPTPKATPKPMPEPVAVEEEEEVTLPPLPSKPLKTKTTLISERSAEASIEALQTLVQSIPKQRPEPSFRSGATLEELVIEALKPQLSSWLDENLPKLVRHLVEKEIKRLIPKDE